MGDDNIYAGVWEGDIYLGVVRFDLSSLPEGVMVFDARLTLSGQRVISSGDDDVWSVHKLDSSIDAGWPSRSLSW